MRYRTWPNAISLLRLPLAVVFVAAESTLARGAILGVGALSDYADGWFARRFGQRSRSGEILDGLTDKIFIVAALSSFLIGGRLELWEMLVLLARDIYTSVAFIAALAMRLPIRFRSRWGGKIVTVLQIIAVLVLLLWPAWITPVVYATGLAGVYAIVDYTRAGVGSLRDPAGRA